jgi:hypothetical protein
MVDMPSAAVLQGQLAEARARFAELDRQRDQLEADVARQKREIANHKAKNKGGWGSAWSASQLELAKMEKSLDKSEANLARILREIDGLSGHKQGLERQNYGHMLQAIADRSTVDFDRMDLTTLMLVLFMERAQHIEDAIKVQSQILQEKNLKMAEANEILQMVRAGRPAKDSGSDHLPGEAIEWANRNGIDLPKGGEGKLKQAQWDQVIENIKGHTDQLSNTSQMDMIKLENLLNKRNQSFDFMSNFISKMAKVDDGIIGNIR